MFRTLMLSCALAVAFVGSASGGGAGWPQPDARDKALLASVLQGMKTELQTVRLTQLPAEWRKGRSQGTLELVTTASINDKEIVPSIRAEWETGLIAHAYNEQCVRTAAHCIAVAIGPRGGGAAGRSRVHRPFWSASHLAHAIRSRFAAAGLRVTSIAFEHPYAFSPIITIRSSHPQHAYTAEVSVLVGLMRGALRHSEGSFIEMFGSHGRLLLVQAPGEGWCAPLLHCAHL